MESVVIRYETGAFENRGFAKSPFCIIYGFGGVISFLLLQGMPQNLWLTFLGGALFATIFELITAKLMLALFGKFWWDYSNKKLNYKGILCLESTLAWGLLSVINIKILFGLLLFVMMKVPPFFSIIISFALILTYGTDFITALYREKRKDQAYEKYSC